MASAHRVTSAAIAILVAAPVFATLYSPIYSRITPTIGDFPFFYFYLLIVTPGTSLALWLATLLQRRPGQHGDDPSDPNGGVAE